MGYRYEQFDKETESWIRIKAPEIKKNMRIRVIDEDENVIAEGRLKEVDRLWVKETNSKGIEEIFMDLNLEFLTAPPKEERPVETVFPPTTPPWKG